MSEKYVNVELFALTYGSLVLSIVKETNNIEDANAKLAKIGTSIGNRITDDIVVSQDPYDVKTFKQACSLIAKSMKTYLGINCQQIDVPDESTARFRIDDNPITRFVTIPLEYDGLVYLTPLLSALKTIFAMLHFSTEVRLVADRLRGAPANEIEVKLIEVLTDTLPLGEYLN